MEKIKKILDFLTEIGYLGAIFLIPLYFSAFFPTNNIFELNKLVLFKLLVLFLFLITFAKIILFKRWQEAFGFFNKKFIFIGVFLIALMLSTLLALDSQLSYFGLYSRFQGLESHFYYILFFVLIYANLLWFQSDYQNLKNKIKHIVWVVFTSSFLVSLYAIFQYFGYDYFIWAEPALLTKRAFSSLGQPNFLASFLLLAIPLSIYLYLSTKKFLQKFFIFLVLFFQISALFFSGSRGGFLGLLFMVFIFGLFYFIKKFRLKYNLRAQNNKKSASKDQESATPSVPKKRFGNIFYYLIFIILFLVVIFSATLKDSVVAGRFLEMKDLKSGSIALRIDYWKHSLDAIKKRPLFGYGLDSQRGVFASYYQTEWGIYSSVNTVPHRAHNLFLDILLTAGIVGLIAYLGIFYLFFREVIKIRRKSKEFAVLASCLLVGTTGYLVSLFFGFAIAATQVYFWLFFALILVMANFEKINFNISNLKSSEAKITKVSRSFLIVVLALVVFYQAGQEFKYLRADYYFGEMKSAFARQNYFETLEYWEYIKEEKLRHNYYKKEAGLMIADLTQAQKEEIFKKPGQTELEEILTCLKGNNYFDILLRAEIYQALGEVEIAEKFYLEAIKLSPRMPRAYLAVANFYHSLQDFEKGVVYYQKTLVLLPDFGEAPADERHFIALKNFRKTIHENLGDAYFEDKNYEMAEKYYKLALNDNPGEIGLLKKIADTYYQRQDLLTAIWYNKHGMIRNPSDFTWPFVVGLLYQELEQNDLAFDYFQQALELSPNNKFIQNELNKLSE